MNDKYKYKIEKLFSSVASPTFNPKEYIWILGNKVLASLVLERNKYLKADVEFNTLYGIEVHEGRDYGDEAIMLLRDVTKTNKIRAEIDTQGKRYKSMELIDTINDMTSSDYKKRFKAEYNQLDIRLKKLRDMIEKYEAGKLDFKPTTPIDILKIQAWHMSAYKVMLIDRARIESIDIESED